MKQLILIALAIVSGVAIGEWFEPSASADRVDLTLPRATTPGATVQQDLSRHSYSVVDMGTLKPQVMHDTGFVLPAGRAYTVSVGDTGASIEDGDLDCYLYEGTMHYRTARLVVRDVSSNDGCQFTLAPRPAATTYSLLVQNQSAEDEGFLVVVQ
jgi:hypothetical protein